MPGGPAPDIETGPPEGHICLDPDGEPLGTDCGRAPDDDDPEEGVPDIPPITVEDVVRFAPDAVSAEIEPYGIAVMNAPMNVAFDASTHTESGELFDLPVSVTFTPDTATIDYGDGTAREVAPGAPTWGELGQEQLTATATSHAYAARGTYTVTMSVSYSAVVDFGAWGVHPVNGLVTPEATSVDVRVYELRNGLVDRDCLEDPTGPGCRPVS